MTDRRWGNAASPQQCACAIALVWCCITVLVSYFRLCTGTERSRSLKPFLRH
jgi:hypothetical protein